MLYGKEKLLVSLQNYPSLIVWKKEIKELKKRKTT
jgi:hypothetical protein